METSIVSYPAARPSRDVVMVGHQASANEWWEKRRANFEVFISRLRRLQIKKDAILLAKSFVAEICFPENAEDDALHVALAATHGMDFLLTWNFTHIANAVCEEHGLRLPVICSPDELMQI